jgi:malonyl-CoA O-methyltransferase
VNRIAARKTNITAAFNAAAATYDAGADVQLNVARKLTACIGNLRLPVAPRVLEIGCGTGFLTRGIRDVIDHASWTVTDISPAMTMRCRAGIETPHDTSFVVMDGEAPCFAPREHFDLICSSLAFQWFESLPASLAKLAALLRPGGHLVFATLAEDSFSEWRRAYTDLGETPAVLDCLPVADIHRAIPKNGAAHVDDEHILQPYANGHAFLQKLRQIGAHIPARGHRPATPGTLRHVLRAFDSSPETKVTYHVAYGTFTPR